jgi:hypothetical protein
MQKSSDHNTADFSALLVAIKAILPFVEQDEFYRKPTQEQIKLVRAFLDCAQSYIQDYQARGCSKRHFEYLTEFYNEADDILKRVIEGSMQADAELVVMIKEGPVPLSKFMTNTVKTLCNFLIHPERMPNTHDIRAAKRDVSHFPIITKLNDTFGQSFFDKHPKAKWESKSGTSDEGTVLELRGVQIPEKAIQWFSNKLNGKFRFEFSEGQNSNKILRILDAEGQIARERSAEILSNPNFAESKEHLQAALKARGQDVDVQKKDGWSSVLAQVIINGELEPHGLDFSDDMRAQVQNKIKAKFDELYSKGIQFRNLSKADLNGILLDIQHQFVGSVASASKK